MGDLPQAGIDYYRSLGTGNGIDVTETGANYTWDYTSLERTSHDTFRYDQVSQTPVFYQFLFNNPLSSDYYSTEAKSSPDVDIGGFISMTDNYLFSKQTSSYWNEVGIGTTITGLPLPTTYTNIKTKLNLPLNYQSTGTDDYSYLIQIPTLGAVGQDGTLTYEVDGWGTMKLPGGTYDVLRVKTELNKSDTIFLTALGFGLRIPTTEIIYEWYAVGEGYPVLTVNTTLLDVVTGIEFSDNLINGIDNSVELKSNRIFPNPVKNELNLVLTSNDLSVTIIDVSGKVIMSPGQLSPSQIDVSLLPKGLYFIKLENQTNQQILRFIKQ